MGKTWMKHLLKLDLKLRLKVEDVIESIYSGNLDGLDLISLKGKKLYFRCRVGKIRIIYREVNQSIEIYDIGFRGDVYK